MIWPSARMEAPLVVDLAGQQHVAVPNDKPDFSHCVLIEVPSLGVVEWRRGETDRATLAACSIPAAECRLTDEQ
ncbi:hypothetical protein [Rhodococcus sp. IEGM 1307]|uniref:hypothetical protein n=1 Tax=Rhodococcus sp. IEGM 1307 TaxID=3047091 RepID=UPI0024B77086|nr:hypothetical protein [Rhodococcus sp. IEGM 1307]MDI9979794.1 hypothetical protein [Rhodococcus sp. IEGM 1307]